MDEGAGIFIENIGIWEASGTNIFLVVPFVEQKLFICLLLLLLLSQLLLSLLLSVTVYEIYKIIPSGFMIM